MIPVDQSLYQHRWPVRIYYEDTDAAGVVYYANYLRFCERARTEWLRAIGFEQKKMLMGQGFAFVVTRIEADYRRSAELDDAVEVCSSIDTLGRASVIFKQTILRGTEILFVARVTVACLDRAKGRPVPLPDTLRSLLENPA